MQLETRFLKLCRRSSATKIRELICSVPTACTTRSADDATALHLVVAHNPQPHAVAAVLIEHGADVNARGYRNQNKTVLHEAAWRGCPKTVRLLVQHGARVNAIKSGDWTALMIACARGNINVVQELLLAGARVDLVNRNGETALHLCARAGCSQIVSALVAHHSDVRARTKNGRQPLHYAARAGHVAAAEVLISSGASLSAKEASGMTPVVEACAMGRTNFIRRILQIGESAVWETDCGGLNGLHHAALGGHSEVVWQLAVLENADINVEDARAHTALYLAVCNRHQDTANALLSFGAHITRDCLRDNSEDSQRCGKCHESVRNLMGDGLTRVSSER
ncbi:Ankyrin repeat domain-containing protein 16 [Gracilariopsis chorda]|uniref:Ankyrin repeat domain-containing protein 16 n=1 Tax=Gracilariopsis chorda TaxID=448386 RepID=A0A2V3IVY4_9FLOR|nr:Ankyrin repeat domain-containing protein 16 [Gracilariopsis chorda]|eukprot:PXF46281.1 Ankyrin repeat domain-containing protein 16 [Gracilariopsis chorda]